MKTNIFYNLLLVVVVDFFFSLKRIINNIELINLKFFLRKELKYSLLYSMKKTKQKKHEKMFDLVIYMKTISIFYIQNKTWKPSFRFSDLRNINMTSENNFNLLIWSVSCDVTYGSFKLRYFVFGTEMVDHSMNR